MNISKEELARLRTLAAQTREMEAHWLDTVRVLRRYLAEHDDELDATLRKTEPNRGPGAQCACGICMDAWAESRKQVQL